MASDDGERERMSGSHREQYARTLARVRGAMLASVRRVYPRLRIVGNPYVAAKLFPLQGERDYVVIPPPATMAPDAAELPVPPRSLWEGYGDTADEYLASGQADVDAMLDIVRAGGMAPDTLTRILELGCAAGRMLRFCPRASADAELWGVDIKAAQITWCQEHLPPPFRFATTTTLPHLPFEDRYFDFVFCGSVFTHIGDLADAWLLELRRILRPRGMAFITIHDEHSVDLLLHRERDRADLRFLVEMLERLDADTGALSGDYAYFAIGNEPWTQVFYKRKHLLQKWGAFMTVVSVTPEAYGYQTALLLRK